MPFYPEGYHRVQQALSAGDAQLNLSTPGDTISTPGEDDAGLLDSPGLQGSFQQILAENLGHYVQIDFLVGVETLVRRSGIIYAVGRSFVVLYDETNQNFVMCDVFSAKFVAFFARRPRPGELPNNPMGILKVDATGNLWPVESMQTAPHQLPGTVRPAENGLTNSIPSAADFSPPAQPPESGLPNSPQQSQPIRSNGWVRLG